VRLRTLSATLVAGAFALAACGGPSTGTVTDKRYSPGYVIYHPGHFTTVCASFNAKGMCTSRYQVWTAGWTQWVPDSWKLQLRNGEDEGWTSVPESNWQACTVGQTYDGGRCG
jgi:hypothetical protein